MAEAPVLTDLVNLQNETSAVNAINANNAAIKTAFEDVLSLSGTAPNQMQSTLDMNNNQIINIPAPTTANSPVRLQDLSTVTGGGTVSNIPTGGSSGQVLTKNSNANFDTAWETPSGGGGGGGVTSVGLALPSDFTVTNSPVTVSGTITGNWATTPTGTGAVVRASSPILVSPTLGTPAQVNLINATGLPLSTGVTGTMPSSNISGTFANASLANMNAFTIKGNATNAAATPTDISIPALTQKSSPVSGDMILLVDSAASDALKFTTVGAIGTIGSVSSIAGNTGAFTVGQGVGVSANKIELTLGNVSLQTGLLTPTGTASSGAMCGMGSTCILTPAYSGRVYVCFNGWFSNSAADTLGLGLLAYGTGTAPSNGAGATGTFVGGGCKSTFTVGTILAPFNVCGVITGLTPGVTYWFDCVQGQTFGGTTSLSVCFSGYEF